jgi:hypothetical protein
MMMFMIAGLVVFLIIFISYVMVLKPYFTAMRLKKEFESKGYKVLIHEMNFFKLNSIAKISIKLQTSWR